MADRSAQAAAPKVTVLIPVYNRERYVAEAIESILRQSFADLELLLIDDGSTDKSRGVILSYRDPRIRVSWNGKNLGVPATRAKGVQLARGQYLAFLDSDDTAMPKRIAEQVAFLDAHPDYAAVSAWVSWMDEEGHKLRRIKRRPVAADEIAAQRLFRSPLENSAAMARTAILLSYGHREHYELEEDYDLWARIAADHKLATLPKVLVQRRAHSGSATTRADKQHLDALRLQIFQTQIELLGVCFTAADVERHLLLRRMQKVKFHPDAQYLDWADTWLGKLQTANQHNHCYPEPAFSHVLGQFWFKACWHAAAGTPWQVWKRFWASPLHRQAWPALRSFLALHGAGFLRRRAGRRFHDEPPLPAHAGSSSRQVDL